MRINFPSGHIVTPKNHINMEADKKMCLKIHGRVQGVFFRASAQRKARELGLTGYVVNLSDGSVYLEAEGNEAAQQELEDWCHQGPASADVERVEKTHRERTGFSSFQIRHQ